MTCHCHGEHPPIPPDIRSEILMALGLRHSAIHTLKGQTDDRDERDALSDRMRLTETAAEWVKSL